MAQIFLDNAQTRVTPFKEQGRSGAISHGGWIVDREKRPKLTYQQRFNTYEEYLSNIAVAGAGVRYFVALAVNSQWKVKQAEADESREYADIVSMMMTKAENPWSKVISHALLARFLGFSVQEWTAYRDQKEGKIFYRSIENRPQRTIEKFNTEDNGNILGFVQRAPDTGLEYYIPRAKTFYMVDDLLTDSPAGMGVLRHIADSCDRLENYMDLEKQGYEKDLRNIPVARVPYSELALAVENGELTEEQSKLMISEMENLVRMARKSNYTGLLIDSKPYISKTDTAMNVSSTPQWDIGTLGGDQANTTGLPDIAKAIERLQVEIARCFGTEAMLLSGGGSQALSTDKSRNLYLQINSALNDVKFRASKDLIDPIWRLNGFPEEMKPEFEVEEVSARDAEAVAAIFRDMASAGATMSPDDDAINWVRDIIGAPKADLEAAAQLQMEDRQRSQEQERINLEMMNQELKANGSNN